MYHPVYHLGVPQGSILLAHVSLSAVDKIHITRFPVMFMFLLDEKELTPWSKALVKPRPMRL